MGGGEKIKAVSNGLSGEMNESKDGISVLVCVLGGVGALSSHIKMKEENRTIRNHPTNTNGNILFNRQKACLEGHAQIKYHVSSDVSHISLEAKAFNKTTQTVLTSSLFAINRF